MAPLQKRALLSLMIGVAFAIALIVVFLLEEDVTAFNQDSTLRWITYAALIGVPLSYLLLIDISLRRPTQLDERDQLVLLRTGKIQYLAVIFALAAWMISLTEIFQAQRQVPVVFLNLIFISTLILGTLAQSAGILIGYWRLR